MEIELSVLRPVNVAGTSTAIIAQLLPDNDTDMQAVSACCLMEFVCDKTKIVNSISTNGFSSCIFTPLPNPTGLLTVKAELIYKK